MAVTYGFYNALNHDRLYDAIQMSSIFDGIIRDGIFSTIGDTMIVTSPEDGMYVNVGSGRAWFNHTWTLNDTAYPIEAEEAEVVLDRIDAVILEVNSSAEVRANSIKFLKGTPSSNPVKPTLTHNAEVNQYALAYVRIRAGQTTIFQSDIENAVGTDETPLVTGVLQQVSIETLLKQWEAEFNTYFTNFKNTSTTEFNNWFATKVSEYTAWFAQMQTDMDSNFNEFDAWFQRMKDQLDENQAGHLQLQIDNLSGRIDGLDAEMPFAGGSKVNINFEYDVNPNVQYSNEHYKLTVGDTVRENNFSSSNLHFDEYGILTVGDGILEVTYDITDSRTGKVTHASYTYTINMPYFGRFAYNVTISASLYDYQGWLESIGKDPSHYSTIEDVFADEKLLRELMTRHASVDYLVEWLANNNEDAHTVLNNDYCAKWINLRDYALDMLYANPTVKSVMDEVDKYGYGEWALVGQVPKMTSNTAPYGECSGSSVYSGRDYYYAFNEDTDEWLSNSSSVGQYLQYTFTKPIHISGFQIKHKAYRFTSAISFKIQGYNGDNWEDISEEFNIPSMDNAVHTFDGKVNATKDYQSYRVYYTSSIFSNDNSFYQVYLVQLYAWQPKGAVPVMTSNAAPYGKVSASSNGSAYPPYKAFDNDSSSFWAATSSSNQWIQYKFSKPTCIKRIYIENTQTSNGDIMASNDGSNWNTLKSFEISEDEKKYIDIQNNEYYLYYRLGNMYNSKGNTVSLYKLQFYGRQLNVSVPTMTSNTAPWGEASMHADKGSSNSSYPAWKAFDKVSNLALWNGNDKTGSGTINDNAYIRYRFANTIVPRMFGFRWGDDDSKPNYIFTVKVQGSNDGILWEDLSSDIEQSMTTNMKYYVLSNANNVYKYMQLLYIAYNMPTDIACPQASEIQFYGVDYSEREFGEGSTMKYLYDHGVELEPLVGFKNQNDDLVDTDSYEYLYMEKKVTAAGNVAVRTVSQIDLTNYALMRAKVGNIFVGGNNAIFVINLQAPTTADPATAISGFNANNLPYNNALDLSNINQSLYCYVGLVETNTATRKQSITEWWLE